MEAQEERWVPVSPNEAKWYEYFEMYLKDSPLRRSSECIAMHSKCISKMVP